MKRQTRTRRSLQEALLELLQEKEYVDINIRQIAERANTARITFYRHYRDKDELLIASLQPIYDILQKTLESLEPARLIQGLEQPPMLPLFLHIAERRKLYRALLTRQVSALVMHEIRRYTVGIVQRNLRRIAAGSEFAVPVDVLANYIVMAQLGLILWWLQEDTPYSVEYLAQKSYELVLFGVRQAGFGDLA
jgi:AcrR family transcriptional regulator